MKKAATKPPKTYGLGSHVGYAILLFGVSASFVPSLTLTERITLITLTLALAYVTDLWGYLRAGRTL